MSKKQPTYTDEFKHQIVTLHQNGKPVTELSKEYGLSRASIYTWLRYATNSGSFKVSDNRSDGLSTPNWTKLC